MPGESSEPAELGGPAASGHQLVAYVEFDPEASASKLMLIATNGGEPTTIAVADETVFLNVAWSPDGSTIAYTAGPDSNSTGLYVVPAGGGEPRLLAAGAGGAIRFPVWSPDGSILAFARHFYEDGSAAPFLIAADGTQERPLTAHPSSYEVQLDWACSPLGPTQLVPEDWSPDGESVLLAAAATCADEVVAGIAIVEADGTGLRQVTDLQGQEFSPAWSPDGSTIAFEGPEGIYTVAPDGTGLAIVEPGLSPQWAPSSNVLAFVKATDPTSEASYDVWSSSTTPSDAADRLESSASRADAPRWSADGTVIGFIGMGDSTSELYFIDATGGAPVPGSTSGGASVLGFSFQPAAEPAA